MVASTSGIAPTLLHFDGGKMNKAGRQVGEWGTRQSSVYIYPWLGSGWDVKVVPVMEIVGEHGIS
jgi:hypothetical protein